MEESGRSDVLILDEASRVTLLHHTPRETPVNNNEINRAIERFCSSSSHLRTRTFTHSHPASRESALSHLIRGVLTSNMDTVDYSQNRLDYLVNQLHAYDGFNHKG
jgi:hypothetical protein